MKAWKTKRKKIVLILSALGLLLILSTGGNQCAYAEMQEQLPVFDNGYDAGRHFYQALKERKEVCEVVIRSASLKALKETYEEIEYGRFYIPRYLYGADPVLKSMGAQSYSHVYLKDGKDGVDCKVKITYNVEYIQSQKEHLKYNNKIRDVSKRIDLARCRSEKEEVEKIYQYICENIRYRNATKTDRTPYGAIFYQKANCQGFAELFFDLCGYADIDAAIIHGRTKKDAEDVITHAWNLVRIGKKWYNVDASWDAGRKKYKYFLKSDEYFEYVNHFRAQEFKEKPFVEKHPMCKPKGIWMKKMQERS